MRALAPPAADGGHRARAIHITPRAIVNDERFVEVAAADGRLLPDAQRDICLAALVERRPGPGSPDGRNRVGHGLVSGLGLRSGAIATTIAHDAHHLLVVGADTVDMLAAAHAVAAAGGGLAVVKGEMAQVLPLPLAGLMADLPVDVVAGRLRSLERAAAGLGVDFEEPFMVLSFITLSVIPRLRLTLDGLLDVERSNWSQWWWTNGADGSAGSRADAEQGQTATSRGLLSALKCSALRCSEGTDPSSLLKPSFGSFDLSLHLVAP
jgi:adenine deaminase